MTAMVWLKALGLPLPITACGLKNTQGETDVSEMRGCVSEAVSDSIEVQLRYKNATDAWTNWFTRLGYI